jgi:hypothetical protein
MPEREPSAVTPPTKPASADLLMPVGVWVRLELPGTPVVGYTYVDPKQGSRPKVGSRTERRSISRHV